MNVLGRVELAHEPDFVLGRLTVSPSRRELVRGDGGREVIEHRVMQVLIALSKANGRIVTREELTMSCWDGRVVGEDSIHRVMSRLRKVANGIAAGSFEIETITKIGYRLTASEHKVADCRPPVQEAQAVHDGSPGAIPTRRHLLIGAAGALAAAGGGAWLYRRMTRPSVPPEVQALMIEADQALNQATREGQNQAISLYRRVVELEPDFADGWGLLGFAYALPSHFRPSAESETLRRRAEAAGRRALELDPGNANGELALAVALPTVGNWRLAEQRLVGALATDPDNENVRRMLAVHHWNVGRTAEAAELFGAMRHKRGPISHYGLIATLWSAGRIEEADRAMERAVSLYPTHPSLWFLRFDMRAFGGHPAAALAMLEDVESRPTGVEEDLVDDLRVVASAIQSRDPKAAEAVTRRWMTVGLETVNDAVIAIRVAAAFGRLNDAFALADAYHLGRGFTVPIGQNRGRYGADVPLEQRWTAHLFEPVTRLMRADPRFDRLIEEVGLGRYWREAGARPDYRRVA